jgi:dTDP-4-dehydrorhamnose reductase
MSILVTGKNGQVGQALLRSLAGLDEIVALDRSQLDLADLDAVRYTVQTLRPDLIINAAAYTAVDRAEQDRDTAFRVNAESPAVLARACAGIGAAFVHYSTDYVFDGQSPQPYTEVDVPAPQSVYGQSKWAGERAVQAAGGRHLVFRTSWVVGAHGGNFLKTMLRLGAERDSLRVGADQHGAPTSTELIAHTTVQVLQQMRAPALAANTKGEASPPTNAPWAPIDDPRWGLYHLAAAGETTWHAYACHVMDRATALGWPMRASAQRIEAIATDQYPLPAPRPANSRLNTQRLQSRFGVKLPDWQAGVDAVIDSLPIPHRP